MLTNSRHAELAAAVRREVPERPGVYLFLDRFGNTIYVGKSVNLRARMSSYLGRGRAAVDDRVSRMIYDVDRFQFRETGSELLALLLEDVLIKSKLPTYNVRMREYEACRYLALTDNQFPWLKAVDHHDLPEGSIFGPFRDEYFAAEIRQAAGRFFGLRTCTDPVPRRKCANQGLGICAGPCEGSVSTEGYAAIVARVTEFLNGDETWLAGHLERRMRQRAENHRYEEAAKSRDELTFWTDFCRRQHFIGRFKSERLLVEDHRSDRFAYQFVNGSLIRIVDQHRDRECIVPEPLAQPWDDARLILDRAHLLHAWLNRNSGQCSFEFG